MVELMFRRMRRGPSDWENLAADRLALSTGYAVPIVYAVYADLGSAVGCSNKHRHLLRLKDLSSLRELSSVLDGHRNPAEGFPSFDAATGPPGQGPSVPAELMVNIEGVCYLRTHRLEAGFL